MMLSKSQFLRGIKCPKSLWLYKKSDIPRDEPDEGQMARFEAGKVVGDLAKELFPGGREVAFDPENFPGMIKQTREWLNSGVDTIYEATVRAEGGFAMADILRRVEGGWEIYEVKSSTLVKDYHLYDVAFQYRVFWKFGIRITRACVVYLNNNYVRQGDLDIKRLFVIEDVTDHVIHMQEEIERYLLGFFELLNGDMPEIDIGPHCSQFYECDYHSWCWRHVPRRSVFDLYRLGWDKRFELYRNGIREVSDLPDDFDSNAIRTLQIQSEKSGRPHVDRKKIWEFLSRLVHPIHFFDFETFSEAIPRFDGQRPYMQMPFQYSLHILYEDGRLEHKEFLADENKDPRGPVITHMLRDIKPNGSMVAYNKSFEERMIRELAEHNPTHKDELLGLLERFEDLIVPFRSGGYYHPDFNGSFSLKSVLPAIFPDDDVLNYQNLEIRDGGMAMEAFASLHQVEDMRQREQLRSHLLEYCKLDTLALVKLYEFLSGLAKTKA